MLKVQVKSSATTDTTSSLACRRIYNYIILINRKFTLRRAIEYLNYFYLVYKNFHLAPFVLSLYCYGGVNTSSVNKLFLINKFNTPIIYPTNICNSF